MPNDPATTIGLLMATVAASLALGLAIGRLRRGTGRSRLEGALLAVAVFMAVGLLAYRATTAESAFQPLNSHVDGLLLLTTLVGVVIGWLHWAGRLRGADVFGLPVLLLLLAWGVCASWWTFRPFEFEGLWEAIHVAAVYIGTASVVIAGALGAMYLYVRRQLRRRDAGAQSLRLLSGIASLQRVERWLMRSVILAFAALTLVIGFGAASMAGPRGTAPNGATDWSKLIGGMAVWLVFAVLVAGSWAPGLRGRGAAWLSVAGLGLMICVMAISLRG